MKIKLKNQIIRIGFSVSREPNLEKLERELADFFSKNEIEKHQIKKFRIEQTESGASYNIIPQEPPIEQELSGTGLYKKDLEEIGEKYGIRHLDFIYWCYHK